MEMMSRIEYFSALLNEENLDFARLQNVCFHGCPDVNGIRSMCWKILLHYLPKRLSERQSWLDVCRSRYLSYMREFVLDSSGSTISDHPLSSNTESEWNTFFADNEVLLQITKDCRRLCPEIDFFHRTTAYPCILLSEGSVPVGVLRRRVDNNFLPSQVVNQNLIGVTHRVQNSSYETVQPIDALSSGLDDSAPNFSDNEQLPLNSECHWEVIQRILYIFYKTHTGQGYIQGMNEIIAPLYYIFATDPNPDFIRFAEADTFYCFNNLMTEIHANFIRKLDNGPGIRGQMKLFIKLLAHFDKTLAQHLHRIEVHAEYYTFRWLSLLLAREFLLPDVIRLWDSLFSDHNRFQMLPYVACAMLLCIRSQLLSADFSVAVSLLQNYPPSVPLNTILNKAMELYNVC